MNTVVTTDAPVAETAPAPVEVVGQNAESIINKVNIPHPLITMQDAKFHFRKNELGVKKPTVSLSLPIPTLDGLLVALEDPKQQSYVLEVLAEQVVKAARVQVNDETNPVENQSQLDLSKLTIEFLANMPKAERTGGGISKEVWEAFGKDYAEVMPGVTGKNAEQIGNAVKILLGKFQPVKTNKKVISFMKEQLALYTTSSTNIEEFQECIEFLDQKADTLLATDDAKLLENL